MAIKRYTAEADTTITNAYKANFSTRGTGSNMGQSDILEAFSIFAQVSTASSELSRILVKFPATGTTANYISYDREQGNIPVSGSVNFYLKLFNAKHSQTVPKNFTLSASALSRSWDEGLGLDMEEYSDWGYANWVSGAASSSIQVANDGNADGGWATAGGDYFSDSSSSFTQDFDAGFEDLEINITPLVEQWINSSGNVLGSKSNYGLGIHMASDQEDASDSYYTKKFFARGSQFFFKRPIVEARWDSSKKDNRGNFYYSSSLAPAADNLNTIYLYNYVRGSLKNIPCISTGSILVSIYSGSADNSGPSGSKLKLSVGGDVSATGDQFNVTGGCVSTGIYSASFAFTGSTSLTRFFDVWHTSSFDSECGVVGTDDSVQYFTGSVEPETVSNLWPGYEMNPTPQYVSKIVNLKSTYSTANTNTRFRLYTRKKDWSPNIYSVSSNAMPIHLAEDVYYRVIRATDNYDAIPYGTGSDNHTRLSYDMSGSYFDLDMSLLEPDNTYIIKFVFYLNGQYAQQTEDFKFRLE